MKVVVIAPAEEGDKVVRVEECLSPKGSRPLTDDLSETLATSEGPNEVAAKGEVMAGRAI